MASIDPFTANSQGRRVLPSFSLAERDRRFAKVRELMAERNLDCLLVPFSEVGETQANARYLSQVGGVQGGAWVVVPADGEVTAVLLAEREVKMWQANLEWPSDLRWGTFSTRVPERIKELALEEGRIGVVGLVNQQARPEGTIPFETWRRITAALPKATFVPANEVLDLSRVVKGPEEVAVIQRITDANEAAIERMFEVARPGVEEGTVWMEMAEVRMRHTADYPARMSLGSNGAPANASNTMGLPIAMEDGGILSQEIDARLQGYRAQCNHSILIGSKDTERYTEAMNGAIAVFEGLVDWLKPGRTVHEMTEQAAHIGEEHHVHGSAMMHTNGLGSDRPRYAIRGAVQPTGGPPDADGRLLIEPGWTFTIKAHASVEATGASAGYGEPVTITETGARRLGHREIRPFVTG